MSNNESNQEFFVIGSRIRQYRLDAGLTQEYVAEKIGISQKHLSRIESGYHNPHFETIIALAKILDVSVNAFVEDFAEDNVNIFLQAIKSDIAGMSKQQLDMLRENIATIKKFDF